MAPIVRDIERDEQGAPKTRLPSTLAMTGIDNFPANEANVGKSSEEGERSRFFDWQSPKTRADRRKTQEEYVFLIRRYLNNKDATMDQLFNTETFVEYSKLYLSCCVIFVQGRIGDKPKARTLFTRMHSLAWWATRRMDDFHLIQGLETGSREKNVLADAELSLFYRTLTSFDRGLPLWKQSYLLWLLVYMCGVRPGSVAVGRGYEAGAEMGDGSVLREADETLKWSDCEFRRTDDGIAVRITFKYLKGHRNQYTKQQQVGRKVWTFLPLRCNRLEFDLALLLTVTAFERGLFEYATLETLFSGREVYLKTDAIISQHPVFLASNRFGDVVPGAPMRADRVSIKLQEMCTFVGLFKRNTLYSFRRCMIQEIRRKHGTEFAKYAAGHGQQSNAIEAYDEDPQADVDWVADRLDLATIDRNDIRRLYSQYVTDRVTPSAKNATSPGALKDQLLDQVRENVKLDSGYIDCETRFRDELDDLARLLQAPRTSLRNVDEYRKLLISSNDPRHAQRLTTLEEILKQRRNIYQNLKYRYIAETKQEMLQESKGQMQIDSIAAEMKQDSEQTLIDDIDFEEGKANESLVEEDGEGGALLDEEAIEGRQEGTMAEPEGWGALPNHVEVRYGDDETTGITIDRLGFAKKWVALVSKQRTGLTCLMCAIDPTVAQADKERTYLLSNLHIHLRTKFHSREAELRRAFNIDVDDQAAITCPVCPTKKRLNVARFLKHIRAEHPEQL